MHFWVGAGTDSVRAVHVGIDVRMVVPGVSMRMGNMVHLDRIGGSQGDGGAFFLRLLVLLVLLRINRRGGSRLRGLRSGRGYRRGLGLGLRLRLGRRLG